MNILNKKFVKKVFYTFSLLLGTFLAQNAWAQESLKQTGEASWAFLAAAFATAGAAIGAGLAVASVGAAAMGAISEKPELAGRAIIFIGLAEGIAIYGLIIAIMILSKV